jgi:hypothetical protein
MTTSFRDTARISGGETDLTEYVEAVKYVHLRNAGLLKPGTRPHPAADDIGGQTSATDVARTWLHAVGRTTRGLAQADVLAEALKLSREIAERGGGTTTFAGIVANVAHSSVLIGWERVRHTWRDVCRTAIVDDFRRSNRAGADEMTLAAVGERGEITVSPTGARNEYATPVSYAGLLPISRAALLADERQALVLDPLRAGIAASGTVNQALFTLLAKASAAGPTLTQTGRALFNTTDGTLAASGAAPSVTTLNAGRAAMRKQTDASSARVLNIPPRFLLAPAALEGTARVLCASNDVAGGVDNLRPLADGALDGISATGWYLLADPNMHDTFEAAFVGLDAPEVYTRPGWEADGLVYKVRLDFCITPLDFRGVYRNPGA